MTWDAQLNLEERQMMESMISLDDAQTWLNSDPEYDAWLDRLVNQEMNRHNIQQTVEYWER